MSSLTLQIHSYSQCAMTFRFNYASEDSPISCDNSNTYSENELFELVDCLDIHYFPTGDLLGSPSSIINLPPTSPATAGPLQISDKTP